jgi:hypothetical protein
MDHLCHARGCKTAVPPVMFMCRLHWYMIPKKDRDLVWALYQPGQEITKTPTMEYLVHADHCIDAVAKKEGIV